jgi:hypothetical protein
MYLWAREWGIQPSEFWNILANDPSGAELVNNAEILRPEVTVIIRAALLPGMRERLAGESSAEEVNRLNCSASDSTHVSMIGHARPMLFQHR